jgi:hypothetical protein
VGHTPLYQRVLKWFGLVLAGALAVGAALSALHNSISLVSLSAAIYATVIILPAWLLTELTAAFFGIPWGAQGSSRIKLRSLGPRIRLGIVGVLTLLWLPQLGRLTPSEVSVPNLQVELRNRTASDLNISTRGEFVLWLPTALYDGAPRIGGKMTIAPLSSAVDSGSEFKVGPGSNVRCSVTFLNPKRFVGMLEDEDTDGSLVIQTSMGTRISPNFAFSPAVVGKQYLEWVIEEPQSPGARTP